MLGVDIIILEYSFHEGQKCSIITRRGVQASSLSHGCTCYTCSDLRLQPAACHGSISDYCFGSRSITVLFRQDEGEGGSRTTGPREKFCILFSGFRRLRSQGCELSTSYLTKTLREEGRKDGKTGRTRNAITLMFNGRATTPLYDIPLQFSS